jgi:hypothetical protein
MFVVIMIQYQEHFGNIIMVIAGLAVKIAGKETKALKT